MLTHDMLLRHFRKGMYLRRNRWLRTLISYVLLMLCIAYSITGLPLLSSQLQPTPFCRALLRRASCIETGLSQVVLQSYIFLCRLLLLAGDVETNPGPIQGRQRAASCQYLGQQPDRVEQYCVLANMIVMESNHYIECNHSSHKSCLLQYEKAVLFAIFTHAHIVLACHICCPLLSTLLFLPYAYLYVLCAVL